MLDSSADEAREALLSKAAQAWADDPALDVAALRPVFSGPAPVGSVGSGSAEAVGRYLRAYYHRVATEDLPSPSRLAAVAEVHARLGLHRPQGRAEVQVRPAGPAHLGRGAPASLVVDIVTDDMPYLVDSVTTGSTGTRPRSGCSSTRCCGSAATWPGPARDRRAVLG